MTNDASTHFTALAARLLDDGAPRIGRARRPWRLAVSGLPGCGKSTLATTLVAQARRRGWPALALSLDDFYLPRRARAQLAARVHPLLATRGVPGTHELALLRQVLARLPHASAVDPVAVPRFDKGRDTRLPPSRWPRVSEPPRLLVLEGWCLGVPPQSEAALAIPVNALERNADSDGRWRRWVNQQLRAYLPLWRDADRRVALQAPDWDVVRTWRGQAERRRRATHAPHAMDAAQLTRFLQHYERIGRHALATLPAHADRVFQLDAQRHWRERSPRQD